MSSRDLILEMQHALYEGTGDGLPLDTAAWHTGPSPVVGAFKKGDFFLGQSARMDTDIGIGDGRHGLIAGGTRGGKGVSIIVPNLIRWAGSTVTIDPKGENALLTARRRGHGSPYAQGLGQMVRILDPFDVVQTPGDDFSDLKASYNPLTLLNPARKESIDEAARIADALIVSEQSNDPFWEQTARNLLKSVMLHVASAPGFQRGERTLLTVRALITQGDMKAARLAALNTVKGDPPSGMQCLFAAMKRNPAFGGTIAREGEALSRMENNAPRMFESVVQVAKTNTDFIDSPGMDRVLGSSSFDLSELKTDPKGTNLYLSLPQRHMETHFRWLRMMTTLIVTEMERVAHQPRCGHPVLMTLDEFPSLRRMRVIENAAAQIAGYGVKMVFVVQTLAQLKDIYKDNWETLVANAGVKLFFCNEDHFTRDYVSKLIGDREVIRETRSRSESRGVSGSTAWGSTSGQSSGMSFSSSGNGGSSGMNFGQSRGASFTQTQGWSRSQTEGLTQSVHKRALLTPDEVGRAFGNPEHPRVLVLAGGHQPMVLDRIAYHEQERMGGCFDPHPDHPPPPTLAVRKKIRTTRHEVARSRADLEQRRALEEYSARKREDERLRRDGLARQRQTLIELAIWLLLGLGTLVGVVASVLAGTPSKSVACVVMLVSLIALRMMIWTDEN